METTTAFKKLTISTTVDAPIEKVWQYWSAPEHIIKWNTPSPDWHSPRSENDLRTGGKFNTRMEAKDGSFGFDFAGVYDEVVPHQRIVYTMGDGRIAEHDFTTQGNQTKIVIQFDAENENPLEFQQAGWQAILDSFKKYTEEN